MFSAYTSKMKLHLITLGFGEHHTLYNIWLTNVTWQFWATVWSSKLISSTGKSNGCRDVWSQGLHFMYLHWLCSFRGDCMTHGLPGGLHLLYKHPCQPSKEQTETILHGDQAISRSDLHYTRFELHYSVPLLQSKAKRTHKQTTTIKKIKTQAGDTRNIPVG